MRADPEGQFEAAVTAYRLGDLDMAANYFSEDCAYAIYIPTETVPFGGAVTGRAAILDRWKLVVRDFGLTNYEARPIMALGDKIRTQIDYAFRHRASGEEIDGVMRIEAAFKNGKIIAWHEFHDADRIQAFVRLCKARTLTADGAPRHQPSPSLNR